jgi:hypothetical protein
MISQRWSVFILSMLLVLASAGITLAEGEGEGVQAQAAVETPAAVAAEEAAAEEVAPSEGEQVQPTAAAAMLVPAAPPPSLQTLVDERRDQIRMRREAMFDAMTGRYAYLPPWQADYDRTMDGYRDAMRALYRQQRDYSQARHDALFDAMCPWHKPMRDSSRVRNYLIQMDQLDRREAFDSWLPMVGRPVAYTGSLPW